MGAIASLPRIMVKDGPWPTIFTVWFSMSPDGVGGEPDDVGEVVVELDDDGVSGVVGADDEYDDADDGEGVEIGGWATFVRICWSDCLS